MVKDLIKPKLFSNGQCETIFDPAMGTAGFLITSYKYLKKQASELNI